MKVSFQVAKIWQTAKRSPDTFWGPSWTTCFWSSCCSSLFLPFSYFSALSTLSALSTFGYFVYLVWAGAGFATYAIGG